MLTISYSGRSRPSALAIAEACDDEVNLVRRSSPEVDINWGRNVANSKLNPNINNSTNKRIMRELFKEHGVPTPRLLDTSGSEEGNDLDFAFATGKAIVGRPDNHTKGRGFWKCQNWGDVRRALDGTRRKKAATHFMEFVSAPYEYRVHVLLGRSIRISQKSFVVDDSGNQKYTTIKPTHNVRHVRRAAKKAVAALGLDFGAVDILANDEECWVLEVNAAPGLGGTMPNLWANAFKKWKDESFG